MKVSQNELIAAAKAGEVVSFPTDTVPALAVRPDRATAIFALKHRSLEKPLILMAANFLDLQPYIQGTPSELAIWQQITQEYWPGALTLVLPASELVPEGINPGDRTTIGIRVPDLPLAREILSQTGALATTSANHSGESPLETTNAIAQAFPDVFLLHRSDLPCDVTVGSRLPSTVAKWTGEAWEILRQGNIVIKEK
ncbi:MULTISPECIES: L-threonylcarbamoyladenylate synthase [Spirulina sp. CCY15215]|uniref:L-threonylcarbamoyladenylate synthase n=1 Tax=Spirulina sp. CCY15215 TaxID=2767591 RepID=UPI0019514DBA|nr:L-threonylcarbamoyladenylate synthase [Spirulina major]